MIHIVAHHGAGSAPDPSVPEIKVLYVAGDWVGKEGRLADCSMASVELVTQYIIHLTRKHPLLLNEDAFFYISYF